MGIKKSPGGSIYPYPYKGGELFGLHYGSFFDDEQALLERMKAEEEFIRENVRRTPLWIDFYETRLTDRVLIEFVNSIGRLGDRITRLAIAGCSRRDRGRLLRLGKKNGIVFQMPVRFFSDPEVAKTWLVSEGE